MQEYSRKSKLSFHIQPFVELYPTELVCAINAARFRNFARRPCFVLKVARNIRPVRRKQTHANAKSYGGTLPPFHSYSPFKFSRAPGSFGALAISSLVLITDVACA